MRPCNTKLVAIKQDTTLLQQSPEKSLEVKHEASGEGCAVFTEKFLHVSPPHNMTSENR